MPTAYLVYGQEIRRRSCTLDLPIDEIVSFVNEHQDEHVKLYTPVCHPYELDKTVLGVMIDTISLYPHEQGTGRRVTLREMNTARSRYHRWLKKNPTFLKALRAQLPTTHCYGAPCLHIVVDIDRTQEPQMWSELLCGQEATLSLGTRRGATQWLLESDDLTRTRVKRINAQLEDTDPDDCTDASEFLLMRHDANVLVSLDEGDTEYPVYFGHSVGWADFEITHARISRRGRTLYPPRTRPKPPQKGAKYYFLVVNIL